MKEFHKQLKKAMDMRNMTQSELCEKTKIPKSAMSQYISGAFKPKQKRTYLIAKALGVNAAWLMGYDDIVMESKAIADSYDPATWKDHAAEERDRLMGIQSPDFEVADAPVGFVRIPVIGNVAAGTDCFAETNIEEYITCDASLVNDGYDYCYLRVKGDSMEPLIREKDLVLVRIQEQADSGAYAVVLVDEENGLVKRVEYDAKHLTLISENPYYPPRRFEREDMNRVRVFGIVVEVRRRFI